MFLRLSLLACLLLAPGLLLAGSPPPLQQALTIHDDKVNALLARMTLDEKIGQMTQAEQDALEHPADIERYHLGSLLSGGNSDPKAGNSMAAWRDMVDSYQSHALRTRLGIPLLYGVDSVHGHSNVIGAVIFPHNIGLGCTRDPGLVEEISRITALETRATGINWVFAPCVTVPRDIRWGRTYEGYGESPDLAKMLGEAAVFGLQGSSLDAPTSVLACAKHFIGDGGTTFGTGMPREDDPSKNWPLDRGDTRVDFQTLMDLHGQGYIGALNAGVGSIMPSYSSWNGEKCSGSKALLTDLLKDKLGFQGFLISDYNAIDELPGTFKEQVAQSINAGMDMMMIPTRYRQFISTLRELVEEGTVPMSRIDDAVRRILRVKFAMGLMDRSTRIHSDKALVDAFGSEAHRAVARQAVRESLVLLKNENGTLPLSRDLKHIHVVGAAANDLGTQCGGWTIDWQGGSGDITEGTTVLEAIRAAAPNAKVTYAADGAPAKDADVIVAVIAEPPYAEMFGDRDDLSLPKADADLVAKAAKSGTPVVTILFSGRPMILGKTLDQSDAFIAAWLPGTEGAGIADVLFGDYAPTGKLSFSWPRSMEQVPIRIGDKNYDPLFPYGFGLSF